MRESGNNLLAAVVASYPDLPRGAVAAAVDAAARAVTAMTSEVDGRAYRHRVALLAGDRLDAVRSRAAVSARSSTASGGPRYAPAPRISA